MRRYFVCLAIGAMTALAVFPRTAAAQGYGVYEQGSCAMGRAGTGVSLPCDDGSSIFFNPAGIAFSTGQHLSVGATIIAPRGGFTEDATNFTMDLNHRYIPVPSIYYTRGLTEKITAGLGVFAPYGLETNWPSDGLGRFLGYKSLIQAIYIQPTAAIKLNDRLAIGAGFDLTYLNVELRQHLDLSAQEAAPGVTFANLGIPTGTDFADAKLSGNAWGAGFHVGIQLRATDKLSLGARYLARQKININDGTIEFSQINTGIVLGPGNPINPIGTVLIDTLVAPNFGTGAPLSDQGAKTSLRLPEQIVLGASYAVTPELTILFDYQHTNWMVFEALVINAEFAGQTVLQEDYVATNGYRFGGEYAVSPSTAVRLGFLTHDAAAPNQTVTPNLPEGPRSEFTAGLGTRLGSGIHLDLAYQYIDQADRRGRTVPQGNPNNGLYKFHAHLVGASFAFTF